MTAPEEKLVIEWMINTSSYNTGLPCSFCVFSSRAYKGPAKAWPVLRESPICHVSYRPGAPSDCSGKNCHKPLLSTNDILRVRANGCPLGSSFASTTQCRGHWGVQESRLLQLLTGGLGIRCGDSGDDDCPPWLHSRGGAQGRLFKILLVSVYLEVCVCV